MGWGREMKEISKEQQQLIMRASSRRYNPIEIIHRFYNFLSEKPADEPLDPKWKEIWLKYKRDAIQEFPPTLIEKIEEALQSIQIVDEEVWKIKLGDKKVTFLLGAGASAPSNIPTVDKLLPELWKRARKIGRDDLDRLAKWCEDRRITNIEDLLTAAYISNFAATNRDITHLLDYFLFSRGRESEQEEFIPPRRGIQKSDASSIGFLQDTLQTLFGLLTSTMISAGPNPVHKAIVEFLGEHKNTSIITTNYDGCMDEAVLKNGLQLKGMIGTETEENNPDAVELIKMHGSINWAYCDSCHDVRNFDLLELKRIYEEDKLSYPVIGICKNCLGSRRPLLVPPLSFKFLMFPNLIDIWNSARQSIESAEYLIVVGYSFSEADTYITKIISRSMSMNKKQKMIIVNTNANLAPNLRERLSYHIDGFDEKRILNACKSCDEILPEILESMLGKGISKEKIAEKKKGKEENNDILKNF